MTKEKKSHEETIKELHEIQLEREKILLERDLSKQVFLSKLKKIFISIYEIAFNTAKKLLKPFVIFSLIAIPIFAFDMYYTYGEKKNYDERRIAFISKKCESKHQECMKKAIAKNSACTLNPENFYACYTSSWGELDCIDIKERCEIISSVDFYQEEREPDYIFNFMEYFYPITYRR